MVLITDSHMTKEEEDKFKNIEIIKSDLFDRKLNRWKVYLDLMKILIFGKNEKIQNFLLKIILISFHIRQFLVENLKFHRSNIFLIFKSYIIQNILIGN